MYQNRFKRDGRVFKCQTFGTIHVLNHIDTYLTEIYLLYLMRGNMN